MNLDQTVPDFTLPSTAGSFTLSAHRGQWLVLYFYPKDSTPGCTRETGDFRDQYASFLERNAIVVGVSRDGMKSHMNFKDKLGLPFELISDTESSLCQQFGVIKLKKLYGREHWGIERSTFLIDTAGVLRFEWRGVKVPNHVEAVLSQLQALTQA